MKGERCCNAAKERVYLVRCKTTFVDAIIVTIDETVIYFSMDYEIQQSVKLSNEQPDCICLGLKQKACSDHQML